MAGLVDSLYRSFQNSRFKPVTPPLAVDAAARVPGLTFGLPWPWTQSDTVDAPHDSEPVMQVTAPRTDSMVAFTLWRDLDNADLEPIVGTAGAQIARLYQGSLLATRKVLLHGARGVLVTVQEGRGGQGDVIWRLVTEWGPRLLHGEVRLPATSATGYEPQIFTMLGTWEWAG